MSTSFKNFKDLNDALVNVYETSKVASFNTALDALAAVVYAAESVASEYAGLYSQVQWMKYSSEGDPDDVTPNQQLAIPDSVIAKLKSLVNKCDAIYDSIKETEQTVVPNPGFLDLYVNGSVSPIFRVFPNGSIQTGVTADVNKIYKPAGLDLTFAMQYLGGNGAFLNVTDTTADPPRSRVITDATYKAELSQFGYGQRTNFMVSIISNEQVVPIFTLIWNSSNACFAMLNPDNQTYKYFHDIQPQSVSFTSIQKFVLTAIAGVQSSSLNIMLHTDNGYTETTDFNAFSSNDLNPYPDITIDNDIHPDLLYNGYNDLKEIILGL